MKVQFLWSEILGSFKTREQGILGSSWKSILTMKCVLTCLVAVLPTPRPLYAQGRFPSIEHTLATPGAAWSSDGSESLAQNFGVLFALRDDGRLSYFSYAGPPNLSNFLNGGSEKAISGGWHLYKQIFSGGPGVLFALRGDGRLSYYSYTGLPNLNNFQNGGREKLISGGWKVYSRIFSGGPGILFALKPNGELSYYHYIGLPNLSNFTNQGTEKVISGGWNAYTVIFSGGPGVLFTKKFNGELSYYSYTGLPNLNNFQNGGREKIISGGWNVYARVFSGGGPGILFAKKWSGQLSYFSYAGLPNLNNFQNDGKEKVISDGWNVYHDIFKR